MTPAQQRLGAAPQSRAEIRKQRTSASHGDTRSLSLRLRHDPEEITSGRQAGVVSVRTRQEACSLPWQPERPAAGSDLKVFLRVPGAMRR